MERLKIEWNKTLDNHSEGYMELNLDIFFPCSVDNARKVFQLVRKWCSDETIAELEKYFLKKAEESDDLSSVKKEYSNRYQRVCDNKRLVESKRLSNGVLCTYDQFVNAQKQIDIDKKWMKDVEKKVKFAKTNQVKWHRMLKLFYANLSDRCTKKNERK